MNREGRGRRLVEGHTTCYSAFTAHLQVYTPSYLNWRPKKTSSPFVINWKKHSLGIKCSTMMNMYNYHFTKQSLISPESLEKPPSDIVKVSLSVREGPNEYLPLLNHSA